MQTAAARTIRTPDKAPKLSHEAGDLGAPRPPMFAGAWPLLGHARQMFASPNHMFVEGYRKHGPVYRVKLGPQTYVIFAGAEANMWLMRNERHFLSIQGIFDGVAKLFNANPEVVMTNVDGKRHKELRSLQKEGMSRSYLEKRLHVALDVAGDFFDGSPQDPVDAAKLVKRLVFRQLGNTLVGEAKEHYYDDYQTLLDKIIYTVVLPWTLKLPRSPRTRNRIERVRAYGQTLLARSRNSRTLPSARYAIDDIIDGVKQGVFDESDLPLLLISPFVAGLDTLAHSMAFAIYGILAHPDVHQTVVEELDEFWQDGEMDAKALRNLDNLRSAIMESMRLYPISPGQRRSIAEDVVVGGYQLKRGDKVIMAHAATHHMGEYFPHPERFDITRYQKPRAEHRTPGAFQPYGVGPHICLGAGMADLQMLLNLAVMFKRYSVRMTPEDYMLAVSWLPTGQPKGMQISLSPR